MSTEETDGRTAPGEPRTTSTLRLLPWASPEGKPCYLSTDARGGPLSRLADEVEEEQLATGTHVLRAVRELFDAEADGRRLSVSELRWLSERLQECPHDALRVAEARGARPGSG